MHAKDGQLTISSIFRILVSENYEEKKKKKNTKYQSLTFMLACNFMLVTWYLLHCEELLQQIWNAKPTTAKRTVYDVP